MAGSNPIFRGAFPAGEDDEFSREGKRPLIFDVLSPDMETSLLPEGYRMVLFVNPASLSIKYGRVVSRIQTKGGWVEQHWGDGTRSIDIEGATGGFMRLYSGMSNTTSPVATGGSRRETLAYDSYLDMLALFHNGGSVYDNSGQIALQGIIKMTFDAGVYRGWLNNLTIGENADKPFQFSMSSSFEVRDEVQVWKTTVQFNASSDDSAPSEVETAQIPEGQV